MVRKQSDSEGGMPFSWERKPGISKVSSVSTTWVMHQCPTHSEREIGQPVSSSSSCDPATATSSKWLPLPPCQYRQPPDDDDDDDDSNKSTKVCVEQQELLKIPLPPCLFQPPYSSRSRGSSSMKGLCPLGLRRQQDPFLEAYKECTKSVRNGNSTNYPNNSVNSINNGDDGNCKHKRGSGISSLLRKKSAFLFSCKHSCEVRDDSIVPFSHLPPPPAPIQRPSKHRYANN